MNDQMKTEMQYPRHKVLALGAAVEGGLVVISLFVAGYLNVEILPLTRNALRDIFIGTVGALPPFVLFLFTLSESAKKIPVLGSLRGTVINEVRHVFSNSTVLDFVIISLLAGIGEELLFRGIIQVKLGIIAASILFGLVHYISRAYVIITVIMGLYIGMFFRIYESLLVPIQIHFVYDLMALLYLKYRAFPKEKTDRSSLL